jgi:GTP-binding protein HflX
VLHVVDASASDEEQDRQVAAVEDVLHEIGAGELPVAVVLNKIDRLDPLARRRLGNRFPGALQVSARTGEGLDALREELARRFEDRWERVRLLIPYDEGGRLSELYALGTPVEERQDTPQGVLVLARLPRRDLPRFAPFLTAEAAHAPRDASRRETA